MEHQIITERKIIGIAVRTTNQNHQSAQDIPQLWNTFHSQQMIAHIPNKINNTVYSIYTAYERDHTTPYTTIIGCEVSSFDTIPVGMIAHTIPQGKYARIQAKGNLLENLVLNEWIKIWNSTTLDRTYGSDFEVYGPKAQEPTQAEVDIYIAIR